MQDFKVQYICTPALEIDRYGFFGANINTDISAIHEPIANTNN